MSGLEASEAEISKAILNYLRMKGYLAKRNQSGVMRSSYNGHERFVHMGEKGWPDIIGCTKDGVFFGIEIKSRQGKTTPDQDRILREMRESNAIAFVARSIDDVVAQGL